MKSRRGARGGAFTISSPFAERRAEERGPAISLGLTLASHEPHEQHEFSVYVRDEKGDAIVRVDRGPDGIEVHSPNGRPL